MIGVLAFVAGTFGCGTVRVQQPAVTTTSSSLVFDGVTVIDVEHGTRLTAQRVVVVGNRIRAMGAVRAIRIPADARVVDARGKYLIPGLWDMHVHPQRATEIFYPLFIANGVTGIRDAGSEVPLDTLQLWRREIQAGTRVGPPRQILSGQSIAGPEPGCQRSAMMESPETCVTDAADARHYIDSIKAAGADMLKPRDVTREMYFTIAAEARRLRIPFGGHAQQETPIEASDSGARIVDHSQYQMGESGLNGLCWAAKGSASVEKCQAVAERFKRNDTWYVPTLVPYLANPATKPEAWNSLGVFARLEERVRAFWSGSMAPGNWLRDSTGAAQTAESHGNMRIMQHVGLPILAGTDVSNIRGPVMPGFSLHTELATYGTEGMTAAEVLRTATLNPAIFLHATDSLGTVAPGKLADLVLLDADPLVDITNTTTIRAVVANGRYFDQAALRQLVAEARAKGKQ